MKLLPLIFAGAACISACSTVPEQTLSPASLPAQSGPVESPPPAARAAVEVVPEPAPAKAEWPSAEPRPGWVETVSGWYPSTRACLEQRNHNTVGTPLSVAEECLKVGR